MHRPREVEEITKNIDTNGMYMHRPREVEEMLKNVDTNGRYMHRPREDKECRFIGHGLFTFSF